MLMATLDDRGGSRFFGVPTERWPWALSCMDMQSYIGKPSPRVSPLPVALEGPGLSHMQSLQPAEQQRTPFRIGWTLMYNVNTKHQVPSICYPKPRKSN